MTQRDFIRLGVLPALNGGLSGYGLRLWDWTVIVGSVSMMMWYGYIVYTEKADD